MSLKTALAALMGLGFVRRWTRAELDARREALESSLRGKPADIASTLDVAEYLVQRYHPHDATLTRAKWARFKSRAERRLREAEAAGARTEEALAQWLAAERDKYDRRRQLLLNSYEMEEPEFVELVGRRLVQARLPLSVSELRSLFQATNPDRRAAADALEDWVDIGGLGIVELVRSWRANYQRLRCAEIAGYEWIVVAPTRRCPCRAGVHMAHRTDDMRRAFETGEPAQLIYPSPTLPCLHDENPRACSVSLYPQDDAKLRIDPEFERQLDELAMRRAGSG